MIRYALTFVCMAFSFGAIGQVSPNVSIFEIYEDKGDYRLKIKANKNALKSGVIHHFSQQQSDISHDNWEVYLPLYLNDKINMRINDRSASVSLENYQYDGDNFLCSAFLEGGHDLIHTIDLKNTFLTEKEGRQTNLVYAYLNGIHRTFSLNKEHPHTLIRYNVKNVALEGVTAERK